MLGYSIAGGHTAPHKPGSSDPPSHGALQKHSIFKEVLQDRALKAQVGHVCEFLTHSSMLPPPALLLNLPSPRLSFQESRNWSRPLWALHLHLDLLSSCIMPLPPSISMQLPNAGNISVAPPHRASDQRTHWVDVYGIHSWGQDPRGPGPVSLLRQ